MWLETTFLVCTKGYSDDFIFAHQKFTVSQIFLQSFEVISGHVIERENIQGFEFSHKAMNFSNDELFMLSGFRFSLGQRNELILFSDRHQQQYTK